MECRTVSLLLIGRNVNLLQVAAFDTLALCLVVEQHQPEHVDDQSCDADVDHTVDVFNDVRESQSLDRLDEDGEAESHKEHGVDESTHHLSACPAVRVLFRRPLRHLSNRPSRAKQVI